MFRHLPAWVFALLSLASVARAQELGGYADYLAWEDWARLQPGVRAGMASSYARTGTNEDYNHYQDPPGFVTGDTVATVVTLGGPGIVTRFWMPHVTANLAFPVRLFLDGESVPRLDTTSDQLLGGGLASFGAPLVTTFAGGQTSYEPIPFRDSLRIETENRSGQSNRHYYQWEYRILPPGTAVESWTGTLAPDVAAGRLAVAALFDSAGQHPAGPSPSSVLLAAGPGTVPAGGSRPLADVSGPGVVRRVAVRMDNASDAALDSLRLRIVYDAEPSPAVDVPISDFFGAGHGRAPYRSLPLGTDSPGGFYCYWPMPFHERIRLDLWNEGTASIAVDSTLIEYEAEAVDGGLAYLHAQRSESVKQPGQILHPRLAVSGAGHYVGGLLFVEQDTTDLWILEGDDIVVVDGADTLNGTGLEDAFNGGYYYNRAGSPGPEPEGPSPSSAVRPLHGILRVAADSVAQRLNADQYRWRIADRIPFEQSLNVSIECRYGTVGSRWVSVDFWYERPAAATGLGDVGPGGTGFLTLAQNFPNPVRDGTLVPYSLGRPAFIVLEVFDVSGHRVDTVARGWRPAGSHTEPWSPRSLASGVYLYRLRAGSSTETRRLVVLR